jgi:mRNA interferase MazF
MKRGEIYYADLTPTVGSEQGGVRPVVIIQNDVGNKYSPTTIIAVVTTRTTKHKIPTHYWLDKSCGLPKDSMIMLEQLRTIDKSRLTSYVGKVNRKDQEQINKCLNISLGLM